jgi:acyl-CoA reductase-like NAD-dependent aldehyde dehydrogenase
VPAIATGCPFIVKPSADTPLSCFRVVKLMHEAGLPPEWGQALFVERDLSEKLVTDPRVAFFSFVGSARVGWMLRAKLAPGTRCTLEHGGAAPVVVAADADMERALPALAKGGFYHAGQVCVSVQAHLRRAAASPRTWARRLAGLATKLKVGGPGAGRHRGGPPDSRRRGEAHRHLGRRSGAARARSSSAAAAPSTTIATRPRCSTIRPTTAA